MDDNIPDDTTYAMLAILDGSGSHRSGSSTAHGAARPPPFSLITTGPPTPGRVVIFATITGSIREDRGLWIGRASSGSTVLPGVVERAIDDEQGLPEETTQARIIATLTDPDPVQLGVTRARMMSAPTAPVEPEPVRLGVARATVLAVAV